MGQHTKEPWQLLEQDDDDVAIGTTTQRLIALIPNDNSHEHSYEEAKANATRIVACVNGCAGLNPMAYRECVEALEQLKHFCLDRMNAASDPAQAKVFDRAASIAWQALHHAEARNG